MLHELTVDVEILGLQVTLLFDSVRLSTQGIGRVEGMYSQCLAFSVFGTNNGFGN